jgi:hypothetical protein
MRAIRTWGSVRGVPGDWHPYRDPYGDATRAPAKGPDHTVPGMSSRYPRFSFMGWRDAINPGSARAAPTP